MSAVRYCVTMTQHHSYIEFAAQGIHSRAKLVCQITDSLRYCTCILNSHISFLFIFSYNGGKQNGPERFIFSLVLGRGRAAECMLFYFLCAAVGMLAMAWSFQWRTVTEHQSVLSLHVAAKPHFTDTSTPLVGCVIWAPNRWANNPMAYIAKRYMWLVYQWGTGWVLLVCWLRAYSIFLVKSLWNTVKWYNDCWHTNGWILLKKTILIIVLDSYSLRSGGSNYTSAFYVIEFRNGIGQVTLYIVLLVGQKPGKVAFMGL